MKADLKDVFKGWFEVAATPLDIAANAVKQYTQGHIQPFVDRAAKSLRKQEGTIDSAHPGLMHSVMHNISKFGNKITEAADTTVAYAKRANVPAIKLPAADEIPGVEKIKQMTGIGDKDDEKKTPPKQEDHPEGREEAAAKKNKKKSTKKKAPQDTNLNTIENICDIKTTTYLELI